MNIAILTTSKHVIGGVERFSKYVQEVLEQDGHIVSVYGKEDLSLVQRVGVRLARFCGVQQPVFGYFLGRCVLVRDHHVVITNGLLGWSLKRGKIINVQHGTFARAAIRIDRKRNIIKFLIKRYIWGYFEGIAARRARVCIAVSSETKESVTTLYSVTRAVTIPNAVDTEFFKPIEKSIARKHIGLPLHRKIAVFVGRFEYEKGKDILEKIQQYLEGVNGEMIIAEHYTQEDLVMIYNAADIFLLPSLHEGCSYALLEAMSIGLPFLASPVGLISDFHRDQLFKECIVNNQTPEAYIEAMKQLFSLSEEKNARLREDIRGYVLATHNLKKFKESYIKVIESL